MKMDETFEDQQFSLLLNKACDGNAEDLRAVIEGGAPVNSSTHDASTALHIVCLNGHYECAKILLEAGANVNAHDLDGSTPLCSAACKGDVRIMKLLVQHNALVNPPHAPTSPLHEAILTEKVEATRFLVAAGAELNCNDLHYGSPLHACAYYNQLQCANILLKAGARVNVIKNHVTPLHVAATRGFYDLVMLLLEHGGDVHAKNSRSRTAMQLTANSDIYQVLRHCQSTPVSLLQCCRLSIRVALTPRRLHRINELNLPRYLIKFLDYSLTTTHTTNTIADAGIIDSTAVTQAPTGIIQSMACATGYAPIVT